MPLQSGKEFLPYILKHVALQKTTQTCPVSTTVNVQLLIKDAVLREDQHFEEGASDSEGLGVSSQLLMPLTESDLEVDDDQPHLHFGEVSGPVEWKHKKESAKKCHAQMRAKLAASRHGPHMYAANPSTAIHHAEEFPLLNVPKDVESFPKSGAGSWFGKRKKGAKKKPWTVPELLKENFKVIEWDGQ
jgi:hypothetical protein